MSFQGINFANQRLLPSDDGRLYQNIFNDGALYGCQLTYSGTELTIAQGHLVIGGRQIEIDAAEVVNVNQAVSGFAQIVIAIDLTKTATISTFNQISVDVRYASSEDGFSTLTQTDINGSGSYYEAQLALLSLGTGGITGIVQNMPQATFKGAPSSGGSGLNLAVVGGTSAPASPKDNTVWVNTSTAINGYAFQGTQPTSPTEGMVWIQTGAFSSVPMNMDKRNPVMIYPTTAKQYINGVWSNKAGMVYTAGTWVNLELYLFNLGNQMLELTGGWITEARPYITNGYPGKHPTVAAQSNGGVRITVSDGTGVYRTAYKVDLTNVDTLFLDGAMYGANNDWAGFYVWSELGNTYTANVRTSVTSGKTTLENPALDVSSLSGEYYVGFGVYDNTNTTYVLMNRLKME